MLLAGLYARNETVVREPHPTRDYTERMLTAFGVDIDVSTGCARLRGGQRLCATNITIPADFSSAAFYLVAASVIPGSDITPACCWTQSASYWFVNRVAADGGRYC